MLLGIEGGIIAAFFVFIGNRLCADVGYAGTIGTLTMTSIVVIFSYAGLTPEMFVAGMVIAITTIQGIHHPTSSKLLGNIAKIMNRYTKLD